MEDGMVLCACGCGNICKQASNGTGVGYFSAECRKRANKRKQRIWWNEQSKIMEERECPCCHEMFTVPKTSQAKLCFNPDCGGRTSPQKGEALKPKTEPYNGRTSLLDEKVKSYRKEGMTYAEVQKAETLSLVGRIDVNINRR